jgi:hypothetical protein
MGRVEKFWQDPKRRTATVVAAMLLLTVALLIDSSRRGAPPGDRVGDASARGSVGAVVSPEPVGGAAGKKTPPAAVAQAPTRSPAPTATAGKPSASATPSAPAASATLSAKKDDGPQLPDLVGKNMQKAHDLAWAAGYHFLESHDALGRGRIQVLPENWKVCDQKPAAGRVAKDTEIKVGVVDEDEECPSAPVPTTKPNADSGVMPDVFGRSVNVVKAGLRGDADVKAADLSDGKRPVVLESHWKVCLQQPAAGTKLRADGKTKVWLGVVRTNEPCF